MKWATVKRCQRRELQRREEGRGRGRGRLKDGQTKGATAFRSRALSLPLPFSGSRAYERVLNVCVSDCGVYVCNCVCECGLCATPVEMLAAVGSIALAQPSAARGRAEILRKSFIMSPMAAL